MRVGVFDSGLGGLTVLRDICKVYKNASFFYVADTKYAPYGIKSHEDILKRCITVSDYLIAKHQIEVLIVACNTATSAAINELRLKYKSLIVIGTEPGIKPALEHTKSLNIGVLATNATLKGEKYQFLVNKLSKTKKVILYEQACAGLVEQIENGKINQNKTRNMLENWLVPMKKKGVDTIVLGCTHYPLVSKVIKSIMENRITLIETGSAIAKRLLYLSCEKGHKNIGDIEIFICHTGKINKTMINEIFKDKKIEIRKCKI
ncbi:MAG: glutamate racemase [Campylobacterota bacterium]